MKRSGGKSWKARPYVRVSERSRWNDIYDAVSRELKELRQFPSGVSLNDEDIDTVAWNLAYNLTWDAR